MNKDRDSFIWQHVDIDDQLSLEKLQIEFLNKSSIVQYFYNPLKLNIKEFLGLEITHGVLIVAAAHRRHSIHTDYRADNLKLALNIPLKNCENSLTEIWESLGPLPKYFVTATGIPYNHLNPTHCKKITEFKLTSPVIFNTKMPHSVVNFSNEPRLAISLRFKEDPWHLVGL